MNRRLQLVVGRLALRALIPLVKGATPVVRAAAMALPPSSASTPMPAASNTFDFIDPDSALREAQATARALVAASLEVAVGPAALLGEQVDQVWSALEGDDAGKLRLLVSMTHLAGQLARMAAGRAASDGPLDPFEPLRLVALVEERQGSG